MHRLFCAGAVMLALAVIVNVGVGQETKQELTKLQGTWTLESRSSGGQEFKQAKALGFGLKIDGDRWTVLIKGKASSTDRIVVDMTRCPMTLDRVSLDGKTTVRGIFKLEGGTMTVAVSPANQTRPMTFESVKGSSTILSVYQRQ